MNKLFILVSITMLISCSKSKDIPDSYYNLAVCKECVTLKDAVVFELKQGAQQINISQRDYKRMFLRYVHQDNYYHKNDLFFIKKDSITGFRELTHYEISPLSYNNRLEIIGINKKIFYRDFQFDYYRGDTLYQKKFNYNELRGLYYKILREYDVPKNQVFDGVHHVNLVKCQIVPHGYYYAENHSFSGWSNYNHYLLSKKIYKLEDISSAFKDSISDRIENINIEFTFTYSGNSMLPGYDGFQKIPIPYPDFKNVIEKEDFGVFLSLRFRL